LTFLVVKNKSKQVYEKLFLVKTSQSSHIENYYRKKTIVIIIIPLYK